LRTNKSKKLSYEFYKHGLCEDSGTNLEDGIDDDVGLYKDVASLIEVEGDQTRIGTTVGTVGEHVEVFVSSSPSKSTRTRR
jgi:hypothetical protein